MWGTLITLNWLPFGGFVKIFGEETEIPDPKSFSSQKLWKRLIIIVAGILANIILAIFLYAIAFSIGFWGTPDSLPRAAVISPEGIVVTSVLKDSPAKASGILPSDMIVGMSAGAEKITPENTDQFVSFVAEHKTENINLEILRGKETENLALTPKINDKGESMIGVGIVKAAKLRLPFFQALKFSFSYTLENLAGIFKSLGKLFGGLFGKGENIIGQVSGPVGIAGFANEAYTLGFGAFFSFMALISLNLAVINLLPFPALDGGRFVMEFFTTKGKNKISPRVINAINQVGFLLLILLMIYVTYKDIARLIT